MCIIYISQVAAGVAPILKLVSVSRAHGLQTWLCPLLAGDLRPITSPLSQGLCLQL